LSKLQFAKVGAFFETQGSSSSCTCCFCCY